MERKLQRDEFVARIMKEREERKKIEAQKRRAAEYDYWQMYCDHVRKMNRRLAR